MVVTRTPPAAIEAEESLLGGVLLRPSNMIELIDLVVPGDFYNPSHQHLFEAYVRLHSTGQPIDYVSVPDELRRMGHFDEESGLEALQNLIAATPSTSSFRRYATSVVDASRRRALIHRFHELNELAWNPSTDIDDILAHAAILDLDEAIASRNQDDVVPDLYTLTEFTERIASRPKDQSRELIPQCLKARWRIIIVAGEGVGKAVLMRFLGLHMAAGRNPWRSWERIEPCRVLYVDVENPDETIDHQHRIANTAEDKPLLTEAGDRFHLWHREGGIDLRTRRHRVEFERVIQQTRPDVVFLGPLYKAYRRGKGEDMEQAALEFVEVIDDLRTRYNFAIVIEHHAPKASSGAFRELSPFGSSLFLRWPEMGITLEVDGDPSPNATTYALQVGRFRRDRVENNWPNLLIRDPNRSVAWDPQWIMRV